MQAIVLALFAFTNGRFLQVYLPMSLYPTCSQYVYEAISRCGVARRMAGSASIQVAIHPNDPVP